MFGFVWFTDKDDTDVRTFMNKFILELKTALDYIEL